MTEPAASRLLTPREACEQLGIKLSKLYKLMREGELASIKMPPGNFQAARRIEQSEIDAFLDRNRVQAVAE